MKSYWVFFFCFHLTKINVFGVDLETIPEEWQKYPKPALTNYHKPLDNSLNTYVSNYELPIITSQVKAQNDEPEINMSFSLPQNQFIQPNTITPQIVTQLEKTDNIIGEKNPNIHIQHIVASSKNIEDDKIYRENINFVDKNKTNSKRHNEQTELNYTKELNMNAMNNNNTINEEVKTDEDENANRSVYFSDDSMLFDYLKQLNKEADLDVPMKEENNKSAPHKEKYHKFKEARSIKYIILALNNISTQHIDKDNDESKDISNESERTPDIEVVINDPDTNVILYRPRTIASNIKTAPTLKDELRNVNNENENCNIDSSPQRSARDNGRFVTEQYVNSISNADNYANGPQIETNTESNRYYDISTSYEFLTLSDAGNKILNRNYPKILRSLRNTDLLNRNDPRKIILYLNYRRPTNKLHFHKDYKKHNNFKPYYLRC